MASSPLAPGFPFPRDLHTKEISRLLSHLVETTSIQVQSNLNTTGHFSEGKFVVDCIRFPHEEITSLYAFHTRRISISQQQTWQKSLQIDLLRRNIPPAIYQVLIDFPSLLGNFPDWNHKRGIGVSLGGDFASHSHLQFNIRK